MTTVFVISAVVGGTVLLVQFVLTLVGLGGDALDLDLPEGVDADGDFGGDIDTDVDADLGHTDSSWMFGLVSTRTLTAAMAFFGLGGLAAQSAGASPPMALGVAIAAAVAAMVAVYWLMRGLMSLKAEGTARIQHAVGRHATVYVTIPAETSGQGKIQMNLQGRTMEYLALTPGHALPPGTKIVVTNIIASDTVEVEPLLEDHQ